MSHLYTLIFIRNGKEHFSTEMRDHDRPIEQARSHLDIEQGEGNAAAALVVKYMQDGLDLELLDVKELTNALGKKDPATLLTLGRTRERQERWAAEQAAKARQHKPASSRPAVFTTQKGGGIKKTIRGEKSQTLHGTSARDAIRIEFGTGKNKRLVPLEDVQRMASQLESASRASARARRRPPRNERPATVGAVLDQVRRRAPIRPCSPSFPLGQVQINESVTFISKPKEVEQALARFQKCDWGEVSSAIVRRNNTRTRKRSGAVVGYYRVRQGVIAIVTWLHKSRNGTTFVALPEEVD